MPSPEAELPRYLEERRPDVRETGLTSPFSHVGRELRRVVTELVSASRPPAHGTVVDYGCADTPYRDLFDGMAYLPVDLAGNDLASVELRVDGTVPLDEGSADLVLSTQVLEHVADPDLYLRECFRLLRPGGSLVLSTHGIMYLHRDPTDYWRWTADGLTLLVRRSGLEVQQVEGVLGLIGASLQLLQTGIGRRLPRALHKPLIVAFQLMIRAADRITSDVGRRENGLVLAVRATKPDPVTS